MRPTNASDDNVFDFRALLHPGTVFDTPKTWCCTHPSRWPRSARSSHLGLLTRRRRFMPGLRAPEGLKAPVSIDAILEALCELDGGPRHPPGGKPKRRFSVSRALAA